jgi:hypothetical protein
MNEIHKHPVSRNLLRTIAYLCLGSGLTFIILVLILVALGQNNKQDNFALLFLAMGAGAGVGGTLWARSILNVRLNGSVWAAALRPGIAFGALIFISAYGLELIERNLFYSNRLHAPGIHLQFLGLFGIAISLVAGITATLLAAQVLDKRQALRHGLVTGLVCAALFIAVDLLMFALGWRVGHPDFPERDTMLTVMSIGLSMVLVAGGTQTGVRIDHAIRVQNEK